MSDFHINNNASRPLISVVIPVYNSVQSLDILVSALEKQSIARESFEIVVVDDDSSEDVSGYLQTHYPAITVVRQKRSGAYAARNRGVAASRGEILAFTDVDCIPDKDWLHNGIDTLRRTASDVVAGKVDVQVDDPGSIVQRYDARFNLKQSFYVTLGFGVTANLFVTRDVFMRVGGFDAELYSGGDQRFCQVAVGNGAKFCYAETARVLHPARKEYRELLKKTMRVAKGRAHAFHKVQYYIPRILSLLPEAYQDEQFSTESLVFKFRFIVLHYLLEASRIFAYLRTRIAIHIKV